MCVTARFSTSSFGCAFFELIKLYNVVILYYIQHIFDHQHPDFSDVMPAAGDLKKAELTIETPVKRPPVIKGNPLERFVVPFSPLLKALSYVALWKNPQLSA